MVQAGDAIQEEIRSNSTFAGALEMLREDTPDQRIPEEKGSKGRSLVTCQTFKDALSGLCKVCQVWQT